MSDFTEISNVDFKEKLPSYEKNVSINNIIDYTKGTSQNLGVYVKDRIDEMNQNDKFMNDNKTYGVKKPGLIQTIKDKL